MFNSERLFLILGELIGVDYLYNQNGRALQDYESFIKTWEDGSEVDVEGVQLHMDEIEAKDMPMAPLAEDFTPNPAEIIQHQMEKHVQLRSKPVQPVLMDNKPLSKPMEQEVYPTTNLVLPIPTDEEYRAMAMEDDSGEFSFHEIKQFQTLKRMCPHITLHCA